jgi:5-hydroxyisourate hydrolase
VTDGDGRVAALVTEPLAAGSYRLAFDTGGYFAASGIPTFYPQVSVTFSADGARRHYHVPLLLSPYAYSTYRGS